MRKLVLWFYPILAWMIASCSSYHFEQGKGVYYRFQQGDDLEKIAVKYQVEVMRLREANLIIDPLDLQPGSLLFIPTETEGAQEMKFPDESQGSFNLAGGNLAWPSMGSISSKYGPRGGRNHDGIDITSSHGREIKAAASGRVEFAGWQRGYGKTLILDHGRGIKTLYAHNSSLYAKRGQMVKQGQKISYMGSTGRSTGVHLHFEVRVKGVARDPLRYLPRR